MEDQAEYCTEKTGMMGALAWQKKVKEIKLMSYPLLFFTQFKLLYGQLTPLSPWALRDPSSFLLES